MEPKKWFNADRVHVCKRELVSVKQLSKSYGDRPTLSNISFEVFAGEILGLIGSPGAGKTTLMECLVGLQPTNSGVVWWQGRKLAPPQRKSVMLYMPKGILPNPEQQAIEILNFFCLLYGRSRQIQAIAIAHLALEPVLTKRIGTLSKLDRQKLLNAIAFLSPSPLIILDEPFEGFGPQQIQATISLWRELAQDRTLLLSFNQLTNAESICDRFLLLNAGKLLLSGSLETLRAHTRLPEGSLENVFLALR